MWEREEGEERRGGREEEEGEMRGDRGAGRVTTLAGYLTQFYEEHGSVLGRCTTQGVWPYTPRRCGLAGRSTYTNVCIATLLS